MDLFKMKKFGIHRKSKAVKDPDPEKDLSNPEELKSEKCNASPEDAADSALSMEDEDDDDDFITNEVKRRLKELRKNSFMVLIPEESCPDEEGEDESSSREWRESDMGNGYPWCDFDALYDKYCERMLFFDKAILQHLQNTGLQNTPSRSPRTGSKKLLLTCRSFYFKRKDELREDSEYLQQEQVEVDDPLQDLETGYVAHICLTWEALHSQYMQLRQRISLQSENPICYCFAAQAFQQFQVLLNRFIENEPFEHGSRVEMYTRVRHSMPKLLQVPSFQGMDKDKEHEDLDSPIHAMDLIKVIEESILTFRLFLKSEKDKSSANGNLFGGHQCAASLQQVQISLDKKEIKLKELFRKKNARNKKSWPAMQEEVEMLFGLIDIKIVSRVLRMARISKEQLLWCEEKMSKLGLSERMLKRDGTPVLFPC